MSPERRATIRLCLAAGATIALAVPFLNFDNTARVLEALVTNKTGCADGIRPNDQNYPFDAIAVPGAGVMRLPDGSYIPTDDGQTRLQAAAIVFSERLTPRVILLDGVEHPGVSETYLQDRFRRLTGGSEIPNGAILDEGQSTNTATNMRALREIVVKHNIGKVAMVTNMYHGLRSVLLACANGVATFLLPAEDLLTRSPREINAATRWKERVEILSQLWDPTGKIQTLLEKLKRNNFWFHASLNPKDGKVANYI